MTRKGSFTAAMAGFAALLAAAAVVQAAPKPKADNTAATSKGQSGSDKKASAKKDTEKKAAAKKADAKKGTDARKTASKAPVPLPKRRPAESATAAGAFPTPIGTAPILPATLNSPDSSTASTIVPQRQAALTPPSVHVPATLVPSAPISADTLAAVKKAVELTRRGRNSEATAVAGTVTDPVAAKLIDWLVLRAENDDFDFQRYAGFATENPGWPNINQFRRKAEAALFQNGVNDAVIRRYFATTKPLTAKGRLAYARALLAQGDRAQAQQLVRETWRTDALGADLERQTLDAFGSLLSGGDHKARMDRRLYAEDSDAALRAAQRLGPSQVAIVKAYAAVDDKSSKAKALLDAVPPDVRGDPAYLLARARHLRRTDQIDEAAKVMLAASSASHAVHDPDEWWEERRLLARKLLDAGEARTAFRIARDAATPEKEGGRVEHLFTAGWIALRFLHDPATAKPLFAGAIRVAEHPASQSRGHYWYARACEALGQTSEARTHYERAARFSSTYYGQIAHARLGGSELRLPPPPAGHPQGHRLEIVRAMEMLYAIDERDLVASAAADMADRAVDPAGLAALGALAERKADARTLVLLGRTAVNRGLPFEYYAYPTAGLPKFSPIGPPVEPHVAYAIARQESGFNPRARSGANAQGLMQVLPGTAKLVAKRNGIAFDPKKLYDPVYNVQIGAAELGHAIENYRGSYILTFVAYNAGPGRVREWIERFGDPRDPKIDPIDWVERIPFSETRNYVQRVMENMQVYRVRFGASPKLMIEADLRRGMAAN
ncbi:lytic transglycosylase domain-containing protein [Pseudorhodoplanes sp.]|uniref:lytic transglycosylase domain-containing protein n=1 Tax=Pseudorhodoplanes sp. TaxID=1934341 RepID=UPI002B7C9420|nr:lytic transglycosylase domain-containing protein [Pseudorhodoplanes sp.]HWV52551.1 lytic transglycosylase domain-containing protein [Pseudorhodoplanes sp.]